MKKILYTLLMVSLFAVSCTKEVLVSRDHDIDAEVSDITTKMEMTTLYCNLNDAATIDLQQLEQYLTAKSADVVTLVSPATLSGETFTAWLGGYAVESGYVTLSETNVDGELVMAALVKNDYSESIEQYTVLQITQDITLNNAVLHFSVNSLHFVVTEFDEARNAIPDDWADQVNEMRKQKKTLPLVYTPDNLGARKAEVEYVIGSTIEHADYLDVKYWLFSVNMNVESSIDTKYGVVYPLVEYYDNVDADAFIKRHHAYFTVEENLSEDDIYFGANISMVYAGLVDCVAVQHSSFTPTSVDGRRCNYIYSSDGLWNLFDNLQIENSVAWGAEHYPILVTLKVEE